MNSILYVGMDVHTTNYTLCTYTIAEDKEFAMTQVKPDHLNIVRYINRLKEQHGQGTRTGDKGTVLLSSKNTENERNAGLAGDGYFVESRGQCPTSEGK